MGPNSNLPAPKAAASARSDSESPRFWSLYPGAIVFLSLVLLVGILHIEAIRAVLKFWAMTKTYEHGVVLAAVALFITIREVADRRAFLRPLGLWWAAAVIAVGFALIAASLMSILVVQMILLPLLLWGLVAICFDWRHAKRLTFAYALLILGAPVWDILIDVLQPMTIFVTNMLLDVFNRTAFIENEYVTLRHGIFIIERGCSGLNYFLVGCTLGGMYGALFLRSLPARIRVMAVAAGMAILANWIRVFGVIMIGDLTRMQHSLIEDHNSVGWLIFAAAMTVMLLYARSQEAMESQSIGTRERTGLSFESDVESQMKPAQSSRSAGAFLLVLLSVPSLTYGLMIASAGDSEPVAISLPNTVSHWSLTPVGAIRADEPYFPGAEVSTSGAYEAAGSTIVVDAFAYDLRNRDSELVGYPNSWIGAPESRVLSRARERLYGGSKVDSLEALEFVKQGEKSTMLVGYWFDSGITGSPAVAKVLGLIAQVSGNHSVGAIAFSSTCNDTCEKEEAELRAFASDLIRDYSVFKTAIPDTVKP